MKFCTWRCWGGVYLFCTWEGYKLGGEGQKADCYRLNCLQRRHIEVPTPNTSKYDCIWKKSHSRGNTLKLGHWSGPLSNMTDVLINRKDLEINMQKGKIMWGGAGSVARWRQRSIGWCIYKTRNANGAPAKQQKLGERPSKGPMAPTLWPQISRLQKWEIMHFCCWGHHVCGMSQQQS